MQYAVLPVVISAEGKVTMVVGVLGAVIEIDIDETVNGLGLPNIFASYEIEGALCSAEALYPYVFTVNGEKAHAVEGRPCSVFQIQLHLHIC